MKIVIVYGEGDDPLFTSDTSEMPVPQVGTKLTLEGPEGHPWDLWVKRIWYILTDNEREIVVHALPFHLYQDETKPIKKG